VICTSINGEITSIFTSTAVSSVLLAAAGCSRLGGWGSGAVGSALSSHKDGQLIGSRPCQVVMQTHGNTDGRVQTRVFDAMARRPLLLADSTRILPRTWSPCTSAPTAFDAPKIPQAQTLELLATAMLSGFPASYLGNQQPFSPDENPPGGNVTTD